MKRNFVGTGLMLCCLCLFSFLGISQQVPLSIKGHGKVFKHQKFQPENKLSAASKTIWSKLLMCR